MPAGRQHHGRGACRRHRGRRSAAQTYVGRRRTATTFSLTGRFIQVRVTLKPNEQAVSPVLSDLRICSAASGCAGAAPPAPPTLRTPPADIGVTKVDSPDPVSVGSNVTYTLVVSNNGPGVVAWRGAVGRLPAGVTFVSRDVDASASCSFIAPAGALLLRYARGVGADRHRHDRRPCRSGRTIVNTARRLHDCPRSERRLQPGRDCRHHGAGPVHSAGCAGSARCDRVWADDGDAERLSPVSARW